MKSLSRLLTFIAVCSVILSFSSCKKITADPAARTSEYYMKFKVNGLQKEYPMAGCTITDTLIYGLAYGATVAGSTMDGSEAFGLILYSQTPLHSNMTFNSTYLPGTSLPNGILDFLTDNGDYSYSSQVISNSNVQVNLSELTADYMKATFSGKIKEISNGATLTITDGELYAKRQ